MAFIVNSMDVAFISPSFYPNNVGGAGISSKLIVDSLREQGVSVDVFTLSGDGESLKKTGQFHELPAGEKYTLGSLPNNIGENISIIKNIPSFEKYDIVHNYSPGHAPATIIKSGTPVVTTVNGYPWVSLNPVELLRNNCPEQSIMQSIKYAQRGKFDGVKNIPAQIAHYVGKYLLNKSDAITVQNEGMRYILRKCNFNLGKVSVVPNIVDKRFLNVERKKTNDKRVIFLGRLEDQKGAIEVVHSFLKLNKKIANEWKLIIYGNGPQKSKIKELNNKSAQSISLKYCPYNELPVEYAKASVLVHASKYPEPFSRTWLEAMATNTAIVCSEHPSSRAVLNDYAKFFDPFSKEDLTAALQTVLKNDELREKLATKGNRKIDKFMPAIVANKYIEVYSNVI